MNYYFLLKLADEFLDKLKKPLYGNKFSKFEQTLLEHDIIPIEHDLLDNLNKYDKRYLENKRKNFGNSFLNEGMYSKVFKVVYKNKPAIAKITNSFEDIENMQKLHDMADRLGKYKKHILQVYDIFSTNIDGEIYYIAVVEELQSMHKHIKDLFKSINDNSVNIIKYLNFDFFAKFFVKFNLHKYIEKYQYIELCKQSEKFFKNKKMYKDNALSIIRHFYNFIYSFFNNLDIKNHFIKNDIKNAIDAFEDYIFYLIKTLYSEFPMSYPEMMEAKKYFGFIPQEILPETKSFVKFLLYLYDHFKIEYYDIHQENVMQRPSTRDLVLSDPGLFR